MTAACDTNVVSTVLARGLAVARCVRLRFIDTPLQFPFAITLNGDIRPKRSYQTCLNANTQVVSALTRLTLQDLPSLERCMLSAGISIDKAVGEHTSHGVVFYMHVNVSDAAIAHVHATTPCRAVMTGVKKGLWPAVVKLMALPKPTHAHGRLVVKTHDSSLMDPYLTGLGSGMVNDGASVGFAHLYGTFLAKTTIRGVPDTPVVVMVTERLDTLLDVPVKECLQSEHVQWRRLVGLILQVMTVLAQGQALCGLVHNDAHLGNFMVSATGAKPPASTHAYIETPRGKLLRLPLRERVALIDFGRSSFAAGAHQRRVVTSELLEKFPRWEMNDVHADVMHFAAMLLLIQPTPHFFETEAAKVETGDAPRCARALFRLIRAALQCGDTDMFVQYRKCLTTAQAGCSNAAIHTLRGKRGGCVGALPTDWLDDDELVEDFVDTAVRRKRGRVMHVDVDSRSESQSRPVSRRHHPESMKDH